jgi:hypothetical protein
MTKKDYIKFAELIQTTHKRITATEARPYNSRYAVNEITNGLADILAADNPRFDRGRFILACEGALRSEDT